MKLPTVQQIEQMSREEFVAFMAPFDRAEEPEQKMTRSECEAEALRLFAELKQKHPEVCPVVIAVLEKMAEVHYLA